MRGTPQPLRRQNPHQISPPLTCSLDAQAVTTPPTQKGSPLESWRRVSLTKPLSLGSLDGTMCTSSATQGGQPPHQNCTPPSCHPQPKLPASRQGVATAHHLLGHSAGRSRPSSAPQGCCCSALPLAQPLFLLTTCAGQPPQLVPLVEAG